MVEKLRFEDGSQHKIQKQIYYLISLIFGIKMGEDRAVAMIYRLR